tara:strand:+ start:446 stop:976 length:531 start_codon:yes stop_codon:yes gene_type:complete
MVTNRFIIFLSIAFLQSCSSTLNYSIEIDSVENFNIADYNEFSLNMNKSNLSAEVNPIKFQKLETALIEAIEERGLSLNSEANLSIELIIEPKEKLRLEEDYLLRRPPYGYTYGAYPMDWDRLETIPQFILRINVRDMANDRVLWTGLTKWSKSSSKDPLTEEYLQFIVDNILQSI